MEEAQTSRGAHVADGMDCRLRREQPEAARFFGPALEEESVACTGSRLRVS